MLLAHEIKEEIKKGNILVEPFLEENLAINSIDVRLSTKLVTYVPLEIKKNKNGDYETFVKQEDLEEIVIDAKKDNKIYSYDIPEEGLIIRPNILYLGSTIEKAGSDKYVPMYDGRSSMARLGIQSHISAGFGDINFKSNWTLEIIVVHRTKIYANMRIGQVFFHEVNEEALKNEQALKKYEGKYTNQPNPQASKSYLDFQK